MLWLVLGLILFIGAHLTPTAPALRETLIGRYGLQAYRLGFTFTALAGLILIIFGVSAFRGSAADVVLWSPPHWTRHLAFLLMLLAFVLVAASHAPSHIRDWTRHPMLAGLMLWALAHLLANGDLLAPILFGSLLVFALIDRVSLARRGVGPKQPATGLRGDALAIGIGFALWAATLLWLHKLAGVALI